MVPTAPAIYRLVSLTPFDPLAVGMEQTSLLFENVVPECVLHQYHLKTFHFFTS